MLKEAFESAFPDHNFDWRVSGASALGFCPFHSDKHQRSFGIYLDAKGHERWHCFAEGIGGGLIEMVLRSGLPGTDNRSGANHWLIQKGYMQESEQQVKDRARNDALTRFYEWTNKLLSSSEDAAGVRAYLAKRHIDVRTIPGAMVGYYPRVDDVVKWLGENDLFEILSEEVLPERRQETLATGSLCLYYRSSYEEFTRIKLRNVCREGGGKDKCIMFLGRKLQKNESLGYFSWTKEGCPTEDAILVEGEFDVGALATLAFKEDEDAVEPIYCFSGGGNLSKGVGVLLDMGKKNIYLFPDNDEPGIEYSYKIAEQHPQTFVIMPDDYKQNDDPASWAVEHCIADLNNAYNARKPAFAWIGQKLAIQAADATIEEQAGIKTKLIEYAKRLPATDREMFLKNYGTIAAVSYEALLEEVESRSQDAYRKSFSPLNFGILKKNERQNPKDPNSPVWEPISNVILEIERDLLYDAGDGETTRHYLLKATTPSKVEKFEVSASEFCDDKKLNDILSNKLGGNMWIKPRCIAFLRESCTLMSAIQNPEGIKESRVYMTTGWRDDKYYSTNGYVDAEGFHEFTDEYVELPNNPAYMKNFHLAEAPADMTFITDLLRNEILRVFPHEVTLPFLAHTFWSVISNFLPAVKPCCLWVVGTTGSFKTSFGGVMMSFFGKFGLGTEFESWTSTTNAIEKNGFFLRDTPYLIDDYKGVNVNAKNFITCIQNYGDRRGRGRMNVDLSTRKTWFVRANMISTAEDVPEGEASVISRIMLLRVPKGNKEKLAVAQKYAHLLPGVMTKFIQFLLNKHPRQHDLEQLLSERRMKYIADHGRISESLAANSIAWDYVKEFFKLEDLDDAYHRGLETILNNMNATTKQEQAGTVFVETIADMIDSGRFFFAGTKPDLGTPHIEGALKIGWVTPNCVYVLGSLALAEVNKFRVQMTGNPIKYTQNTIYEQLLGAGYITPDPKGKPTKVVKVSGQSARVLEFRRGVLEHCDEKTSYTRELGTGTLRCSNRDSQITPGKENFGVESE